MLTRDTYIHVSYCNYIPYFAVCVCVCVWFLQLKGVLQRNGQPLQVHERLMAGSSAGVVAQTAIYPMEVSLQCQQADTCLKKSSSPIIFGLVVCT